MPAAVAPSKGYLRFERSIKLLLLNVLVQHARPCQVNVCLKWGMLKCRARYGNEYMLLIICISSVKLAKLAVACHIERHKHLSPDSMQSKRTSKAWNLQTWGAQRSIVSATTCAAGLNARCSNQKIWILAERICSYQTSVAPHSLVTIATDCNYLIICDGFWCLACNLEKSNSISTQGQVIIPIFVTLPYHPLVFSTLCATGSGMLKHQLYKVCRLPFQ